MSLLESTKIPLQTAMPPFELQDPQGQTVRGQDLYGKNGLLVVFTCNHCPYAQAVWPRVICLARYARTLEINTVAINPNIHPGYPQDAPEEMLKQIQARGIDFPYLVDKTQETARAFKAQCTPDIYLFNAAKRLVYHGRMDDNWKDEAKVTREELKDAITRLAAGQAIDPDQMPSMGCSIKWQDTA